MILKENWKSWKAVLGTEFYSVRILSILTRLSTSAMLVLSGYVSDPSVAPCASLS